MTSITFYFQVHQPYRLRNFRFFEHGETEGYFDDSLNRFVLERVAERCYLPMNRLLLDTIEETDGAFRCAFALTGTVLEQLEDWAPEALESFQALAATGAVEIIAETSHHSLASLGDAEEFGSQVHAHHRRLEALFGQSPTTFRNTELILDEGIAAAVERMGYRTLLGEGADQLLLGRGPRRAFRPRGTKDLTLLLRDYPFSDDIAFRFSNPEWEGYPLMADTFARRIREESDQDDFLGFYMDFETFGEHQGAQTGILDFMRWLPRYLLEEPGIDFKTPAEVREAMPERTELPIPRPFSWADENRDLSAWLANPMQHSAHEALYTLLPRVREAAELGRPELLTIWRRLSTSDHVYYMSTAHQSDGDVHEYFSPYDSPHDSFIVFMNVLDDLTRRVDEAIGASPTQRHETDARSDQETHP